MAQFLSARFFSILVLALASFTIQASPSRACVSIEPASYLQGLLGPNFFHDLTLSDDIQAFRLDGMRAEACDSALHASTVLLDCFPVEGTLDPPAFWQISRVVELIEKGVWTPVTQGTRLPGLPEIGFRIGRDSTSVDLIVSLKAMKAAVSVPDKGVLVSVVPERRFSDLMWALYDVDPSNPGFSLPIDAELRHREDRAAYEAWEDSLYAPLTPEEVRCGCTHVRRTGTERESAPHPSVSEPPVYPAFAKMAGIQGTVIVRVLVDREGRSCHVEAPRRVVGLEQAAIHAVRHWTWSPARVDGAPVCAWTEVPVEFVLPEPEGR